MDRQAYELKAGSIKNLRLTEGETPPPAPGEVTVSVKAIGLNFADIFAIQGLYSATPKGNFVPGLEYSGVIENIGDNVKGFSKGDKIMGVTFFGAYSTLLNIDQRYVSPLPDQWNFEDGASFLVQALTAYYALVNLGNLQNGNTVLIHSAAGGVGIWANRIAKKIGAYTIGSVGSKSKFHLLEKEGYDKYLLRGSDFRQQLEHCLNGKNLNLVMECIGGKIFKESYRKLAPTGRMVVYGSASYSSPSDRPNYPKLIAKYLTRPKIDPQKMIEENKSILGFNLIWLFHEVEMMNDILRKLKELHLGNPVIGHTFPFKDLPQAIRLFQSGKTTGKVVVVV